MSNNKILTVSYGTFSCTLEGFDDSFGTMKAIAEYFRDLAADDRYFGAEPPQPDAEMLARIAQKEISRRVQAREHEGKIVLSALDDYREAPQTPVAKSTVSEPQAAAASPAPEAPVAEAPAEAPAQPEVDARDAAIAAEAHVDVADLPDTATAEAEAEAETAPEAEMPAEEIGYVADTAAVATLEAAAAEEEESDIVPGQPDADVESFFADSTPDAAASDDFEEEPADIADQPELAEAEAEPMPAPRAAPAPDSIAAKLQRIRAVVAQHDDSADDQSYVEDEHAIATASADSHAFYGDDDMGGEDVAEQDAVVLARHDIEDALDADDAAEQAEDEAAEDDDYTDILNRLAMEEDDTQDDAEAAALSDEAETEDTDEAFSNLFDTDEADEDDAPLEQDRAEEAQDAAFAEDDDDFDIAAETEDETWAEDSDVADAETAQETEEADTQAPQPRARVIKVKRADLEAAIARGQLEEYDDEDDLEMSLDDDEDDFSLSDDDADGDMDLDDLAPAKSGSTSLSPEDERELARELAELEKDIEGDSAALDRNPASGHVAGSSRHTLPAIEDESSGDMTRLMAEADHQMDEPESTTRRNAFAHLRAAVAAKKADSAIGTDTEREEKDRAFRSDLAEVVRPRRPVGSGSRTARPGEARPAPLKLVAEQRIDVDRPRAEGPVRPRRVSAVVAEPKAPANGAVSFAEYAEEMGAHSLSELLEAAAAYMSFVEGFEQFSRPQLMTKVRQVGPEDGFSREDGLRSFGQLLRAGKIEKIKGGRFTVSEDIGYRPDQRAAG
ncbi:hypothetical protein [Sulfitobacter alexandrii]|nr:hypothetical protein [Sulfitobacter alexandrii]